MKSYCKELWFNIPSRRAFINIIPDVEEAVRESGVTEGLVLVKPNNMPSNKVRVLRDLSYNGFVGGPLPCGKNKKPSSGDIWCDRSGTCLRQCRRHR